MSIHDNTCDNCGGPINGCGTSEEKPWGWWDLCMSCSGEPERADEEALSERDYDDGEDPAACARAALETEDLEFQRARG